jgi:hypothetical protein
VRPNTVRRRIIRLTPFATAQKLTRSDMICTLRFRLPDDQGEFDAARLGRAALAALWQIDQHCRSLIQHGEPTDAERGLAEAIRAMIPAELLEV